MEQILHMITMMAPYLLLGFFLAGIMHVFVPASLFRKHMSKPNFKSVMLSTLIGIPIPLCSCGVIPTAMSLRKEGASHGAVIAFLIATPQTGVDSILATYSMMGLPFAIVRPIAALFTAVFGGLMANISDHFHPEGAIAQPAVSNEELKRQVSFWEKIKEVFHYAYFEMMQDIGKWLVIGLAIAALITYIPDEWLLAFKGNTALSVLVVLLCAIPMYVCATGSIPIAIALMMKGLSPGAALVLLMAGPAVNMASMLVIKKVMGTRTLLVYLASIIFGATLFAFGIDYLFPEGFFTADLVQRGACCAPAEISWYRWVFVAAFVLLLANALIHRYFVKPKAETLQAVAGDVSIRIEGMKCNHCAANAQKAIEGVAGVESVTIDLAAGTASIKGAFNADDVIAAVEGLGFTAHFQTNGSAAAVPEVQLIHIKGMKCNHCAANAQKAIEGVAGVESVTIDLAAGTATITGKAALAEIVAAVESLGFSVEEKSSTCCTVADRSENEDCGCKEN